MNQALDAIERAAIGRPGPPLHRQRLPPGHRQRELRRLHRLVRRHRPVDQPRRPLRVPRRRGDVVVRHDGDPDRRADNGVAAAKWMNYVYDPVNAARITAYVQYVSPVVGVPRGARPSSAATSAALAENPLLFPDDETKSRLHVFADMDRSRRPDDHRPLRHDHGRLSDGQGTTPTTGTSARPDSPRT